MSHRGSAAFEGQFLSPVAADPLRADPLATAVRLLDSGSLREAAPLLQQVLREQPDHPAALYRLGLIAQAVGMPDRAIRLLRHALRVGGESPELLNDLGRILVEGSDMPGARHCFQRCIQRYPKSPLGYVSLAYLENQDGRFAEAESLYLAAIESAGASIEAQFNLATLYREWGQLEKALAHYDALRAKHPNHPIVDEARARTLLQLRRWRDGWEAYEARFLVDDEPAKINLDLPIPRWQGESLRDRHLLILHEQGIGDEVQFASCYSDAIGLARECTITCSPRLLPVFQRSFAQATFIPVETNQREIWKPESASRFDFVVPAGSLPRHFRNQDRDFPGQAYLIAGRNWADASRDAQAGLRVGISWWGGARADQIQQRSIPFEIFQQLLNVDGVALVNLQHGCCDEKARQQLSPLENLHTHAIDPYIELDRWFDLIASLDLVISVDNSNVHFAGALGVPTWLLLADHPNWRWPRGCDVTPWYCSVRLIRKTPGQAWDAVMQTVAQQLADHPL